MTCQFIGLKTNVDKKVNEKDRWIQMSDLFFFLGTNERICLVKGKIMSVMKVAEAILEKISEKVDNNAPTDIYDHKGMERRNEVLFGRYVTLHRCSTY